jgi:WD40-like Beta Propeller Repeat
MKPEARLSPDGRWMVYSSNRSGRFEGEVRSFPQNGPTYPVSFEGGGYPRWRADGRELYFVSPGSQIMTVTFTPGTPPTIGKPEALFEVRTPAHTRTAFNFPDMAMTSPLTDRDSSSIVLVSEPETSMSIIVNWAALRGLTRTP